MSESAIIDAMEEHADDPIDPRGRPAKGCARNRGVEFYLDLTGPDRCLAVFVCRRCWPLVAR